MRNKKKKKTEKNEGEKLFEIYKINDPIIKQKTEKKQRKCAQMENGE